MDKGKSKEPIRLVSSTSRMHSFDLIGRDALSNTQNGLAKHGNLIRIEIIIILLLIMALMYINLTKRFSESKSNLSKPENEDSDDWWLGKLDQVIDQNLAFIQSRDKNVILLKSNDIKWLQRLRLTSIDGRSSQEICYGHDQLAHYYHYCVHLAHYPVLFDRNCIPFNTDHLISNNLHFQIEDKMFSEFVETFERIIKNSDGLNSLLAYELNQAKKYARKIGQDCEHPMVWHENFQLQEPSTTNMQELYEMYCINGTKYPNLYSQNSGKYYLPGLYHRLMDHSKDPHTSNGTQTIHLQPDEQWMVDWMNNKFLPFYRSSYILQHRYHSEMQQAIQFARDNHLQCPIEHSSS